MQTTITQAGAHVRFKTKGSGAIKIVTNGMVRTVPTAQTLDRSVKAA